MTARELLNFLSSVSEDDLDKTVMFEGNEELLEVNEASITKSDVYTVDYSRISATEYNELKKLYDHIDDTSFEDKYNVLKHYRYIFSNIENYTEYELNGVIRDLIEESELALKEGQVLLY